MQSALEDLRLDRIFVVMPRGQGYPLHERGEAIPLIGLPDLHDLIPEQ